MTPLLTANAWNVGPRPAWRIVRSLRALLRDHPADVTGLLEASRATPLIRLRFSRRYRVIRRGSDVTALVSRKLPRPKVSVLRHSIPWVGPKAGIPHRGREHLVLDWPSLRIVYVHCVWHKGDFNRLAYAADQALIATAVDGEKPTLVIGDQNMTAADLAATWVALGMKPIRTGAKVDHGAEKGLVVDGDKLGNYDSDHPLTAYDIKEIQ